MKLNKNIKSIAIESSSKVSRNTAVKYILNQVKNEDSYATVFSKDFDSIDSEIEKYFNTKITYKYMYIEAELNQVFAGEDKQVIVFHDIPQIFREKIYSLVRNNRKHTVILCNTKIRESEFFDLDIIGRNTDEIADKRHLNLDIKKNQYWVNDVILIDLGEDEDGKNKMEGMDD